MKIIVQRLSLCAVLCLLTGCLDPQLSWQENMFLSQMRGYRERDNKDDKVDKSSLHYRLMRENPERLAKEFAKKEDFRVISLAMGLHAEEKDASVYGLTCPFQVTTQPFVFGCVPPPPVIFKLMLRYNIAMMQQPNFPKDMNCTVDEKAVQETEKYSKQFEDEIKEGSEKRRMEWEEKNKKSRIFND